MFTALMIIIVYLAIGYVLNSCMDVFEGNFSFIDKLKISSFWLPVVIVSLFEYIRK